MSVYIKDNSVENNHNNHNITLIYDKMDPLLLKSELLWGIIGQVLRISLGFEQVLMKS